MDNQEIIVNLIKKVLNLMPPKPFFCLQLSAMLQEELRMAGLSPNFIAGDLHYENEIIFKMNYSINELAGQSDCIKSEWDGHAWLEIDNSIIDLSIFRTIYSDKFHKKCKNKIIDKVGTGRGCLIIFDKYQNETSFKYFSKEELKQEVIDGILKGVPSIL